MVCGIVALTGPVPLITAAVSRSFELPTVGLQRGVPAAPRWRPPVPPARIKLVLGLLLLRFGSVFEDRTLLVCWFPQELGVVTC